MKTNRMCAMVGNLHRYDELLPLTEKRPLASLPFCGKYRIIDFNLSSIANANIKSLFMVFNEGETQSVFDHIGGGKEWGLDGIQNRYFIQIYQDFIRKGDNNSSYYDLIVDYLQKSKSDYAVYMGSKILVNIDLRSLLHIHQAHDSDMTVVYKRVPKNQVCDTDTLLKIGENNVIESKVISKFATDKQDFVNLSTDIFIIKTDKLIEILREKQAYGIMGNVESFLRERINESTYAYEYTGYLNNIYDINSYYAANMDMLDPQKYNALLYASQKVYTKMKNEVPTYYSESSVVNNSQFATGCMIEGLVENSIIGRGSNIQEGAQVLDSLILPTNTIKTNAVIKYAILDKDIVVEAGVRIEGTPDKPVVVKKGSIVTEDIIGG